jgi:hypothetical protein
MVWNEVCNTQGNITFFYISDDELPDYIMVMIANKRSQIQMIEDLNLFLGENSKLFCDWLVLTGAAVYDIYHSTMYNILFCIFLIFRLHDLLLKLQEVTEGKQTMSQLVFLMFVLVSYCLFAVM